jgi:hypothetical protein
MGFLYWGGARLVHMATQAHRLTRNLVINNHQCRLILEVSKPTGAIFEGTVFMDGVNVRIISSQAGDTEDTMKRTLLEEAYHRAGQEFTESMGLGEWTYEKLNLDGTLAGN